MKRRKFLAMLGLAPLAVKVAPLLKALAPAPVQATVGGYFDYVSMSTIDPIVANCATELGWRAGQSMNEMWREVYDADQLAESKSGVNEFVYA
jgi:hypothetical protein